MGNSSSVPEFHKAVHGLLSTDVEITNHAFWQAVFCATLSQGDIQSLLPGNTLRTMRRHKPGNFAVLLYKCVEQLQMFCVGKDRAKVDSRSAVMAMMVLARILPFAFERKDVVETGGAPAAEGAAAGAPAPATKDFIVIEDRAAALRGEMTTASGGVAVAPEGASGGDPYSVAFATHVLWENKMCRRGAQGEELLLPVATGVKLGEMLMSTLCAACFLPDFSIGAMQTADVSNEAHPAFASLVVPGLLWVSGIASHPTAPLNFTNAHVDNRLLCVRALVAALSGQVYQADPLDVDPVRAALLNPASTPLIGTLICSLFNWVIHYRPAGSLPYTSHWVSSTEELVDKSAALLNILLDTTPFYEAPSTDRDGADASIPATAAGTGNDSTTSASARENASASFADAFNGASSVVELSTMVGSDSKVGPSAFATTEPPSPTAESGGATPTSASPDRRGFSSSRGGDHDASASGAATGGRDAARRQLAQAVSRHAAWGFIARCSEGDFDLIALGLAALLENSVEALRVYLPGSQRAMPHQEEFVLLLWRLLERSTRFLKTFVRSRHAPRFVIPLLHFGMAAVTDATHATHLQLLLFILQRLSCARQWCLMCNAPCTGYIPFELPLFQGSLMDVTMLSLHSIIMRRKDWLTPLHESCAGIIANLSPFATTLSGVTSSKLVHLIELYSDPNQLQEAKGAVAILAFAVEAVANQLQYQPAKSIIYNLVYRESAIRLFYHRLVENTLPIRPAIAKRLHAFTLICALDCASEAIHGKKLTRPEPAPKSVVAKAGAVLAGAPKLGVEDSASLDPVEALERLTLVGALPVPHPLVMRPFVPRRETDAWLASWSWAFLYMHTQPVMLDVRTVELFRLQG